jgi:hypothetical protein
LITGMNVACHQFAAGVDDTGGKLMSV